ncbi:ferrochelatase [Neisseria wadsworthii]|uniref:Ferrochelatase n=1 Tax=Neisseria wadsworthii 9715 TaxID=1030841 RepID=G4CQ43_9NEIS|nr:ferrochelatase [Neisseria wadsworthii]EGZ46992.1 ferrochelatase [Neisseria wadsworthii 9715]QMT34974.1 ferrochelatase [Neisseria wadsworthii]
MPRFRTEPAVAFSEQNRTAVLLLNLGTPEAPTAEAVRPYLREFLSDERVVELPKVLWQPILHAAVLTLRPKKSAHGYEKVWFPEGSPLAIYTEQQAAGLAEQLPEVIVRHAMTYGKPSVSDTIDELKAQGVSQLLVIPLYPQYAASSAGAALDKVLSTLFYQRNMMSLRTVSRFYDDEHYIHALSQQIQAYWAQNGRGDKIMFSFHGVPQANCDKGDPYLFECGETVRLLAQKLQLNEQDYIMAFQSQFGKAKWIGPSTQDLLESLPKQGVAKLDVFCPGFISDCLETMEEIAIAGREAFHAAGGTQFNYIPCLNANPAWIDALGKLAKQHLQGWI